MENIRREIYGYEEDLYWDFKAMQLLLRHTDSKLFKRAVDLYRKYRDPKIFEWVADVFALVSKRLRRDASYIADWIYLRGLSIFFRMLRNALERNIKKNYDLENVEAILREIDRIDNELRPETELVDLMFSEPKEVLRKLRRLLGYVRIVVDLMVNLMVSFLNGDSDDSYRKLFDLLDREFGVLFSGSRLEDRFLERIRENRMKYIHKKIIDTAIEVESLTDALCVILNFLSEIRF